MLLHLCEVLIMLSASTLQQDQKDTKIGAIAISNRAPSRSLMYTPSRLREGGPGLLLVA